MWLQDRDQELELLGCNESGPFYHLFYPLKNDLERYETFIEYIEIAKQVVMVVKNEMRFFYQKRNVLQI